MEPIKFASVDTALSLIVRNASANNIEGVSDDVQRLALLHACEEALAALHGQPTRIRGIAHSVLVEVQESLKDNFGLEIDQLDDVAAVLADTARGRTLMGTIVSWGVSDTEVRETLGNPFSEVLVGGDWPEIREADYMARVREIAAAAAGRSWRISEDVLVEVPSS